MLPGLFTGRGKRRASVFLSLFSLSLALGCGDDDVSLDAGAQDTGPSADAMVLDASEIDTGAPDANQDAARDTGDDADGGRLRMCPAACSPVEQNCDDGQQCALSSGEAMCVEMGELEAGAQCGGEAARCAPGLACFARRDASTCGLVCCNDSDCPSGQRCDGPRLDGSGYPTVFGECQVPERCQPLRGQCDRGEACYLAGGSTDCRATGTIEVGELCEQPHDCVAGATCVGLFEATCVQICELGSPTGCQEGERCIAYAQSPEGTGLCTADESG